MPIRVLIVDDTVIYRKILKQAISPLPDVEVGGVAANGSLALKKLAQDEYQLVLLDVQMPEMDGIETLRHIRRDFPEISVVMVSAATEKGSATAIEALNLGAIDLIPKPQGDSAEENLWRLRSELTTVIRAVEIRSLTAGARRGSQQRAAAAGGGTAVRPAARPQPPRRPAKRPPLTLGYKCLVVGSSTGGPEALSRVIPKLPGNLPVPVLLVQHMPPIFTGALAKDLDRKSALRVVEAEAGMRVAPGTVYIAPGGIHMIVEERDDDVVIALDDGPPENSCKPSVDVLFRSIATVCDSKAVLATILTGMGADGERGVRLLKEGHCYCLAQSPETCVVYGMPQAVDKAGLTDESMDLDAIAPRITELLGGGAWR